MPGTHKALESLGDWSSTLVYNQGADPFVYRLSSVPHHLYSCQTLFKNMLPPFYIAARLDSSPFPSLEAIRTLNTLLASAILIALLLHLI